MIGASSLSLGWVLWPAVLAICIGLDAMFCGLETGIYVMNKNRLDLHAEAGQPAARFLQRMLQTPDRLLAVLLIGTNLTRYASTFAITAMFFLAGHQAHAQWYTLAVATPLLFVVSDSVPKSSVQRLGAEAVYRMTWLLKAANVLLKYTGLSPLVIAVSSLLMKLSGVIQPARGALGRDGVAAVVAEGHASGVLTHFQSVMADRVMRIQEVTVQAAMIPMRRVVTAALAASREELIEVIRLHNYSRLPVVDADGGVAGILNVYDVLTDEGDHAAPEKMHPPLFLPAELTITDALYRMRRARQAMAVVEQDDKPAGIVTIKDLVEEIVGELADW